MAGSRFVYVTYIRTTPERLWEALLDPDFSAKAWFGARMEGEWRPGGAWSLTYPDGRLMDSGQVLTIDPPRRLEVSWRNEWSPEINAEGLANCVYELEPADGGVVKLTVTHTTDREGSRLIEAVSGGWPKILSNLKSLIETGEVVLAPAAAGKAAA